MDGEVIAARPHTDFSAFFNSQGCGSISLNPEASFSDQRSPTLRVILEYFFGDKQLPRGLSQYQLMQGISDDIIKTLNASTAHSTVERPFVMPITPDSKIARISQQNSKFTFHMPQAHKLDKQLLKRCSVPHARKKPLQDQLRLLGVRWDTVLGGLDYLCKEICDMRLA